MAQSKLLIRLFVMVAVVALSAISAHAQCVSNGPPVTQITCTGSGNGASVAPPGGAWAAASNYPTSFTLSGFAGTVGAGTTAVTIVLHGLTADGDQGTCLQDNGMMLVDPAGHTFQFLGDNGSASCSLSNVVLNISDANAAAMPDEAHVWPATPIMVKPGSFDSAPVYKGTGFSGPATSPVSSPASRATPAGTGTFANVFGGAAINGTWKLFMVDSANPDNVSFTSWDLILSVVPGTSTSTGVSAGVVSPAVISTSVTYTATVSPNPGGGTVTFTDLLPGGSVVSLCSGVSVNGSGQAACPATIATEGNHLITATFSGSGSFATSAGTVTEAYRHATSSPGGTQFCNTGGFTAPGVQANQPVYPSYINVTGVNPSVANVTVQLVGLNAPNSMNSAQMMLVSPTGQALEFLSEIGPGSSQAAVNVTFADGHAAAPQSTLSSTTYGGTSFTINDSYPAPAPATFNTSPPDGSAANTFQSTFANVTSNGLWQLFVHDVGGTSSAVSLNSGWCITLTTNANANNTTTAVASNTNPAFNGNAVTISAHVTSGIAVTTGNVTFTENGAQVAGGPASPVAVNGSGIAAFTTSSLSEGDHLITASYSDTVTTFNPSFATIVERINNTPTVSGSNPYVFCNTGAIVIPGGTGPDDIGPANINPSNMIVSGLPGTVNTVSLEMKNYHAPTPTAIASLLVGPAGTNAQSLNFFSGAGGSSAFAAGNLFLADAGTGLAPQNTALTAGATYRPTDYDASDSFTAGTSGFYTLPASPTAAAPHGANTFVNTFQNISANGAWSLYFNQNTHAAGGGVDNGWCLSFTQNLPDITITASHSGTFKRGSATASIDLTVHNAGPGPTGGTIAITDPLPSGMTFASSSSAGWSCSGTTTVTCTSPTAIAASSTSPVSFLVNIANGTADSVTNAGSVSGGGDGNLGNNTFNDGAFSVFGTNLTVNKTHTDPFVQGQTGKTYTVTVTNTGASGLGSGSGVTTGSVVVTDSLPSGLTATGFAGVGWTCSSLPALMCTLNNPLPVGSSSTVTLTVTVSASAAAQITNTAILTDATDQIGTNPVHHDDVTNITGVVTHFSVSGPSNATAGVGFNVTVTALDAGNNTVSTYAGTVHFTSTDGQAVLPANFTFSGSGTHVFSATLKTSGNQTITATDTVTASINGTSGNISVSPAAAANFLVTAPSTVTSGTSFNVTVTARDAFNNTTPSYSGTVHFTTSDGGAGVTLPANTVLASGTGTFQAKLVTNGAQSITATDTVSSGITGSANTTVSGQVVSGPSMVSFSVLFGTTSYNVTGSGRTRLPWDITGIRVVFSGPVTSGDLNSLSGSGITTTGFSGLSTNTLTWTITPVMLGNVSATLAATGPDAIQDSTNTPINGGINFVQALKILWADFNDDGVVNASDLVLVNAARSQSYNIFADLNGDGVVDTNDVTIARNRTGTSLP